MPSRVIRRIDAEVYRRIVAVQTKLTVATGKDVSLTASLRFITVLRAQHEGVAK